MLHKPKWTVLIEPCNTWVQYSWLAEPNNPSSIITWKFHCCFHITRAAYTSKYSQSKIHQQIHHYDISVLQMYTIITVPHFTHTVHSSTTQRILTYMMPPKSILLSGNQEMGARSYTALLHRTYTYLCSFYDFVCLLPMFFETVVTCSGITFFRWWVGRPAYPKTRP